MKKETLKLQNITQDLIQVSKFDVGSCFMSALAIIACTVIIPFVIWIPTESPVALAIMILGFTFAIASSIYYAVKSNKTIAAINNGEFTVTVEYVQNKKARIAHGGPRSRYYSPPKFYLSDGSVFKMKEDNIYYYAYYKWSEYGEMSVDSIFKTTEIGDKLYVVHIGKKRNVMCYNAKQFEPYGFTVEDSHAAPSQDGENSPE